MAKRHRSPSTMFSRKSKWRRLKVKMFAMITHCERCGSGDNLTIHHVKPRSSFPELAYEEYNLVVLCTKCHNRIHHGR